MTIPVSVTQQQDGIAYIGTFRLNEAEYDWTLNLGAPILPLIGCEVEAEGAEAVMKLFAFTLKLKSVGINITERIFIFLMEIITDFVFDFYQRDETRNFNKVALFHLDHLVPNDYGQNTVLRQQRELSQKLSQISLGSSIQVPDGLIPKELLLIQTWVH